MPTFLIFKDAKVVETIRGADPPKLKAAVEKLVAEAGGSSSGGFESVASGSGSTTGGTWLGASLPRGYTDVTDEIDIKGIDLMNADTEKGNLRTLIESSKPSSLASGKGKAKSSGTDASTISDWVESDTDEQLMMFIPFKATLKIHTLHITSLPPSASDDDDEDEEIPMRPKTIQIYTNKAHVLGFEEAEDIPVTQAITLEAGDWDAATGTAKVELRFVKFQNVTSIVVFVVDGDGDGEKVRIDRLRIIGESGEKRDLGKLEKIGDEAGE
jgi:PITH domain